MKASTALFLEAGGSCTSPSVTVLTPLAAFEMELAASASGRFEDWFAGTRNLRCPLFELLLLHKFAIFFWNAGLQANLFPHESLRFCFEQETVRSSNQVSRAA